MIGGIINMGIINIELVRVCLAIILSLAVASVFLTGIAMIIEYYRKEEIIAKLLLKLITLFGILIGAIAAITGMLIFV
jgi:hypothetical protein